MRTPKNVPTPQVVVSPNLPLKRAVRVLGFGLLLSAFLAATAGAAEGPKAGLAKWLVEKAGVKKGIGLDLGPGDAELAMGVARLTELTVHCVEPDPQKAAALREKIDAAGLYGRVVVNEGNFQKLAYPDYCANLIICGDEFAGGKGTRDFKELLRVLNPNGCAMLGGRAVAGGQLEGWLKEAGATSYELLAENGAWAKVKRPPTPGWDEWTHPNHDPSNTYGSNDTTIQTADFRMHWANEAALGLAGAKVMLVAGRQFVECRQYKGGPDSAFPQIYAYDAFNGILLWKRVGKAELPFERHDTFYPRDRWCVDVVATADSVYLLGGKLCHVLDAATGETKQSWPIPAEALDKPEDFWQCLYCVGDTLFCTTAGDASKQGRMLKAIFSLDRKSGKLRWARKVLATGAAPTAVVGEGKVFYCEAGGKLVALDANTGNVVWENKEPGFPAGATLCMNTYYRGKLWLLYNAKPEDPNRAFGFRLGQARIFSATDGKFLFEPVFDWQCEKRFSYVSFSGDMAYVTVQHDGGAVGVLDIETGRKKEGTKIPFSSGTSRCPPRILTPNCLLFRGGNDVAAVLVHSGKDAGKERDYPFRPTCLYPPIPAYGMIYCPVGGCFCPFALRSNICMIPGGPTYRPGKDSKAGPTQSARLVKGPAFGEEPPAGGEAERWVTERHDARHGGMTASEGAAPLKQSWARKPNGQPTAVAVCDGTVFFGTGEGKFYAVDAAKGENRWQYFANGRILTAPYWWQGRVFFGDEDGWVHCLRADNGKLIWKFQAVPAEDRVVAYGGLMSRWPVGCGVVVDGEGTAYFLAGAFPTDYKMACALDARTGAVKWAVGTEKFSPRGTIVLGKNRLYFSTEGGMTVSIDLKKQDHPFEQLNGRCKQLMVIEDGGVVAVNNDRAISVRPQQPGESTLVDASPRFGIQHGTNFIDRSATLPIVTEKVIYGRAIRTVTGEQPMIWYPDGPTTFYVQAALRAEKREAVMPIWNLAGKPDWDIIGGGHEHSLPKNIATKPAGAANTLWEAWKGNTMTTVIKAGGTIYSGAKGKVFATKADDGQELWSAEVPGEPLDLAFNDGRLIVVCDSGTVACFGK